jgi:hypothetical protein
MFLEEKFKKMTITDSEQKMLFYEDNSFMNLKKWLRKEKDHLYFIENTVEHGLCSNQDIEEGDIIISIPSTYMIEFTEIKNERLADLFTDINYHFVLFLYLQIQKKDSFWKDYINSFPKNMKNHSYYFTDKDIQLLNMTSFKYLSKYKKKKREFNYNVKIMYDFLLETEQLCESHKKKFHSFSDFILYLKTIVDTRAFEYIKNNEKTQGLVPYADLLNHSNEENSLWFFNDETDRFEIFALREIYECEQICLSYGIRKNIDLLTQYGFTIEDNSYNELCIQRPRTNLLVTFTYRDSYLSITMDEDKEELAKLLRKKYMNHQKQIKKIKNKNIKQIFLDEIKIIKRLLV